MKSVLGFKTGGARSRGTVKISTNGESSTDPAPGSRTAILHMWFKNKNGRDEGARFSQRGIQPTKKREEKGRDDAGRDDHVFLEKDPLSKNGMERAHPLRDQTSPLFI